MDLIVLQLVLPEVLFGRTIRNLSRIRLKFAYDPGPATRPSLPSSAWAGVKRKTKFYLFGLGGAGEVDGACNHAHGCQVVFADIALVK